MILEEYDSSKEAVINPWNTVKKQPEMPAVVISCFARNTFERMIGE